MKYENLIKFLKIGGNVAIVSFIILATIGFIFIFEKEFIFQEERNEQLEIWINSQSDMHKTQNRYIAYLENKMLKDLPNNITVNQYYNDTSPNTNETKMLKSKITNLTIALNNVENDKTIIIREIEIEKPSDNIITKFINFFSQGIQNIF